MADHSKPLVTSTYANFVTELDGRFDDLALGLDPATTTPTNLPTGAIRWNSASNKWEKWSGTAWADLSTGYAINIAGPSVVSANSTSDALRITQIGSGNALVVEDSANPDSTPFVVDSSGKVGIGTNAPVNDLEVSKNQNTGTTIRSFNENTGASASARFLAQSDAGVLFIGAFSSTSTGSAITGGASGSSVYTSSGLTNGLSVGTTAGPLKFFSNSTSIERARFDSGLFTLQSGSGLSIASASVTAPAASDGNVFSGTYTPTLTNVTNVTSSTTTSCQYMRVGNTVTVSGNFQAAPTATGNTELGISLPIASNFAANTNCGGTAQALAFIQDNTASIGADTTNDRAQVRWVTTRTTNTAYAFSFTYRIM